jgi:hypothetical protein
VHAADIDRHRDLSADHVERREGREEPRQIGDGVVPDVCVRYVRWRVSRAALALLPVARGADLLLHSAQINAHTAARYLMHHGRMASWLGMRLWQEMSARTDHVCRVHKVRFRKLRRAAAAQGHQYIAAVRQTLHVATWVGGNLLADARFRTQRRYRLQRIRVRLLRRAVETQVQGYVRAAKKPVVSGVELRLALDRHEAWVASGWEVGKRADLHQVYLRGANLSSALLADADLHGADLIRADLRDADLEGADLHKAKLRRANLHRAELRWADLRHADLSRADLEGADLKDADLHRANLRGAKLSNAVFEHADLRGANLTRAKGLTQAQIDAADANAETRLPRGLKIRPSASAGP